MSNDYWRIREEHYLAQMRACKELDHAFHTYHWVSPEAAIRSAFTLVFRTPAPESWSDALAALVRAAGGQVPPTDPGQRVAPLGEPGAAVLESEGV